MLNFSLSGIHSQRHTPHMQCESASSTHLTRHQTGTCQEVTDSHIQIIIQLSKTCMSGTAGLGKQSWVQRGHAWCAELFATHAKTLHTSAHPRTNHTPDPDVIQPQRPMGMAGYTYTCQQSLSARPASHHCILRKLSGRSQERRYLRVGQAT